MAKKKLIWYQGVMYYVTSRGNGRSVFLKTRRINVKISYLVVFVKI